MNVTQAVATIDTRLFEHAGRPAFYPEAKPREYTDRGVVVVDAGPPEGLVPHPMIIFHFEKDTREVKRFGLAREGAEFSLKKLNRFVGEEPMLSLAQAIVQCKEILAAARQQHPVGAGWSKDRPVQVKVDGKHHYVPINAVDQKAAREALSIPPGIGVRYAGELLQFPDGWSFEEGQEFKSEGFKAAKKKKPKKQPEPWESDSDAWKGDEADDPDNERELLE